MALAKKRRVDRPARSVELACGRKLKNLTKANPIPVTKEDATQTHVSFPLAEYNRLGALQILGSKKKVSAPMKGYYVTHAEMVRDLPSNELNKRSGIMEWKPTRTLTRAEVLRNERSKSVERALGVQL